MLHELFLGQSSTGVSSIIYPQEFIARPYVVAQVDVTGTAVVEVQGRISSSFDWVPLYQFTATDAKQVTAMPEMRFEVTSYTSGTIDAGIAG